MAEKRFIDGEEESIEDQFLIDTKTDTNYWIDNGLDDIIKLLNELDENWIKELNLRETLQLDLQRVEEENKQLKQLIKKFEKEIHLIHMSSMFSTVKSFNGDVSKRYKYSEETDTIYDTANTYGQYSKILDKKEVVMLLNEYETLLESALND